MTAVHSIGDDRATAARLLTSDLQHVVFVTDTCSTYIDGCEVISAIDDRIGRALSYGSWRQSPGRLAATSDGALVLAASNDGELFIAGLRLQSTNPLH